MTQLTDFEAAVTQALADAQELLSKLSAATAQSSDPTVAGLITQLQASHTAIQSVLAAPATTTTTPAS